MTATLEGACTAAQARQFAGCVTLLDVQHGFTRAEIAERIGVDVGTLDGYLAGATTPDVAQLRILWKLALTAA